jgi:hypothetical protein
MQSPGSFPFSKKLTRTEAYSPYALVDVVAMFSPFFEKKQADGTWQGLYFNILGET